MVENVQTSTYSEICHLAFIAMRKHYLLYAQGVRKKLHLRQPILCNAGIDRTAEAPNMVASTMQRAKVARDILRAGRGQLVYAAFGPEFVGANSRLLFEALTILVSTPDRNNCDQQKLSQLCRSVGNMVGCEINTETSP